MDRDVIQPGAIKCSPKVNQQASKIKQLNNGICDSEVYYRDGNQN
jgi:hypothetical protein